MPSMPLSPSRIVMLIVFFGAADRGVGNGRLGHRLVQVALPPASRSF
jgi:hypothetical protein